MGDNSPRFGLPLLVAGQAQKEEAHNEALVALEALVQPVVETLGEVVPPVAATPGQSWIVGADPQGEWGGKAGALATWTEGGWRFVTAQEGFAVFDRASGMVAHYLSGAWRVGEVRVTSVSVGGQQVVGPRQPAIGSAAGGDTVDAEARGAVAAILAALRAHGLIAT